MIEAVTRSCANSGSLRVQFALAILPIVDDGTPDSVDRCDGPASEHHRVALPHHPQAENWEGGGPEHRLRLALVRVVSSNVRRSGPPGGQAVTGVTIWARSEVRLGRGSALASKPLALL